ncbi:hypothetical protein [endosymbiont GvMRE of Glomus versiforme]|uniref:hypothetical protein n=1 Tax=endosymbiont GvMRE of Glomus versiforme TaxID=2039283 RepID=UPI0011C41EE0|nr:hypothetical protein [endosymbiont GvMRE of Glomus versiforme]
MYKKIKVVVNLIRNVLRILYLIIFFYWITGFVSYARCTSYYEAIKDEKIEFHNEKTNKYYNSGWFNNPEEKSIAEIEEDVLKQIEKKKQTKCKYLWRTKTKEFDKYLEKIEKLKETNRSEEEEKELKKIIRVYREKFFKEKTNTIKNIEKELKSNRLEIFELNDGRNWWQRMLYDPLEFFIISPPQKFSKWLKLDSFLFSEIIFKLTIIELLLILVSFSETTMLQEKSIERSQDLYLSVEEKEQINKEIVLQTGYKLFNTFMMLLFNFFLPIHPAFFDKNNHLFKKNADLLFWTIPLYLSTFCSNLSTEFLHRKQLLSAQELKNYIKKNWAINLFMCLSILAFMKFFNLRSVGNHLLNFWGGMTKFIINMIRVKFSIQDLSKKNDKNSTHIS